MAQPAADVRRWTREEYEHLAETGVFQPGERLELIDGTIYEMTPQTSWHAATIQAVQEALRAAFGDGYDLRVQMPLALGPYSEPEPDLAVVPGHWRDYRESHPTEAALVVEVSESSAPHDRRRKRKLYAEAGIPEYWIVNVRAKRLEVLREPREGDYVSREILRAGDEMTPLAAPGVVVRVGDLLP